MAINTSITGTFTPRVEYLDAVPTKYVRVNKQIWDERTQEFRAATFMALNTLSRKQTVQARDDLTLTYGPPRIYGSWWIVNDRIWVSESVFTFWALKNGS
jgi:hypothetical protein